MNVLKSHKRITIATLQAAGASQREIARRTGVDRKTIRQHARAANSPGVATGSEVPGGQIPPPRPLGPDGVIPLPGLGPQATSPATPSACEAHRGWIEAQVQLGRNAMSIYQDLVEDHGFRHRYNSVKRFVAHLRRREPERFDVLEYLPGEEAQVDYGQGALRLHAYADSTVRIAFHFYSSSPYEGRGWFVDDIAITSVVTDVGEDRTPRIMTLLQNVPNPFNPSTTIRFSMPGEGRASLVILDVARRHVRTLLDGTLPSGEHRSMWDGRSKRGDPMPSGVYLYQLRTAEGMSTRRMVLIR